MGPDDIAHNIVMVVLVLQDTPMDSPNLVTDGYKLSNRVTGRRRADLRRGCSEIQAFAYESGPTGDDFSTCTDLRDCDQARLPPAHYIPLLSRSSLRPRQLFWPARAKKNTIATAKRITGTMPPAEVPPTLVPWANAGEIHIPTSRS